MPKEIINRTGTNCFADVAVRWDKPGQQQPPGRHDARVDLFLVSRDSLGQFDGQFWFEPSDPEKHGLPPNSDERYPQLVGPVSVDLNRTQINRLIRALRRARDQAYGRDE